MDKLIYDAVPVIDGVYDSGLFELRRHQRGTTTPFARIAAPPELVEILVAEYNKAAKAAI
jgi:hypothetical protein